MFFKDLITSEKGKGEYDKLLEQLLQFVAEYVKLVIDTFQIVTERAYQDGRFHQSTVLMLTRHVIVSVDGVGVLARQGCAENCWPLLRSALEGQLGLLYILQADSERRALAYQVAQQHKKIRLMKMCDPNQQQGKGIRTELAGDPYADVLNSVPGNFRQEVTELEKLFALPDYAPIEAEWQRLRQQHARKQDPHWYSLFGGPRTVRELAKAVGSLSMYEFLYRHWSDVVHAGSGHDNIALVGTDEAHIRPIRHPEGLQAATRMCAGLCLSVGRRLLQVYAPDEMLKFQDRYENDIRPRIGHLLHNDIDFPSWH